MKTPSFLRLILLSAIWGASFLFMRIGAPVLGPVFLIFVRVGLAAMFLLFVSLSLRRGLDLRANWRHYLILGFLNSALPFPLFAFAAMTASVSLLSILNATAPIWATVVGAFWTRTLPDARTTAGMLLGIAGVASLVGIESLSLPAGGALAIAAGIAAPMSYGMALLYAKSAKSVPAFANAHGSMWGATLLMIPLLLLAPVPASIPGTEVIGATVALGVLCSGVAYLLYFRLIADEGAASALTVTFLIPLFGIFWGYVVLGEPIGWHTVAGCVLVLAGTALATGFSWSAILVSRSTGHA